MLEAADPSVQVGLRCVRRKHEEPGTGCLEGSIHSHPSCGWVVFSHRLNTVAVPTTQPCWGFTEVPCPSVLWKPGSKGSIFSSLPSAVHSDAQTCALRSYLQLQVSQCPRLLFFPSSLSIIPQPEIGGYPLEPSLTIKFKCLPVVTVPPEPLVTK